MHIEKLIDATMITLFLWSILVIIASIRKMDEFERNSMEYNIIAKNASTYIVAILACIIWLVYRIL